MATFYGPRKNYLNKMATRHKGLSLGALAGVVFLSGIAAGFTTHLLFGPEDPEQKIYVFALFAATYFVVIFVLMLIFSKTHIKAKQFFSGHAGENAVSRILKALPHSFCVYQNLILEKGDIDFVVAGPSGIFTVEVKNHSGQVTYDGQILLRNGRPFMRDFLKQAWWQKRALAEFLSNSRGKKITVAAMLVFANTQSQVRILRNPVAGVWVLGAADLVEFIQSVNFQGQNFDCASVNASLKKLSQG